MRQKIFLFMLLLGGVGWLLAPTGCRKERHTIVKGTITEYGTGTPVKDAVVWMLCYDGGVIFGPGGTSSTSDSIMTGPDGTFYRDYLTDDLCGGIYAIVAKDGYYAEDAIGITTATNDLRIALKPDAWFRVVTVPSSSDSKDIIFNGDFLGAAGESTNSNKGTEIFLYKTWGNRDIHIHWRRWGEDTFLGDKYIYTSGHDTTDFTIHY